jgi:signal transduction histidine kinase
LWWKSFNSVLKDKKVGIEVSLDSPSPIISADRNQMEQVFSNIIKNSIKSVGHYGQIRVAIKIEPVSILCANLSR